MENVDLNKLTDLCKTTQGSLLIVTDAEIIGSLVLLMGHPDQSKCIAALQICIELAKNKNYAKILATFYGMKQQLQELRHSDKVAIEIREFAYQLSSQLFRINPKMNNNQNITRRASNANERSKTIVILLEGVNCLEMEDLCRLSLLNVRGVVSVTVSHCLSSANVNSGGGDALAVLNCRGGINSHQRLQLIAVALYQLNEQYAWDWVKYYTVTKDWLGKTEYKFLPRPLPPRFVSMNVIDEDDEIRSALQTPACSPSNIAKQQQQPQDPQPVPSYLPDDADLLWVETDSHAPTRSIPSTSSGRGWNLLKNTASSIMDLIW